MPFIFVQLFFAVTSSPTLRESALKIIRNRVTGLAYIIHYYELIVTVYVVDRQQL